MNDAADMGAACGPDVQLAFPITAYGQFGKAAAQNAALAPLAGAGGFEFAGRDVFSEVPYGRHIFFNELADRIHGLAAGIVKLLPGTRSFENEIGNKHSSDGTMGESLT